jgi:Transposase
MNQEKYIGMDVHQATISVAVMDCQGKLIMECVLETKAATILEFIHGLRGSLSVTLEEGTSAAWLHDLLKPHVTHLVVCDPRKNALLKDGSKSDRIDARKLADLLRGNQLHAVYHEEQGVRTLKELGRSYQTLTKDVTRVMGRIKALYRSWAVPCSGATVYAPRHRAEWLAEKGWATACSTSRNSDMGSADVEGFECYSRDWTAKDAVAFKEAMKAANLTCRYIPQGYDLGMLGTGGVTIFIGRHPQS